MLPTEPESVTNFRHALIRMETFMAGASLLLLLALVFGQVVARNIFNSGIPAADILSRYMVLYVTFFGAALAVEYHKHIRVDAIAACMPVERCQRIKPVLFLISTILCGLLTWAAMRFWYDDWQYVAQHERWSSVLALITPFGFGLLTLHFLLGTLFRQAGGAPGP
ncbi:MAG: TRAP transporter small permease subunit [Gammaproteobacteria bacterium]